MACHITLKKPRHLPLEATAIGHEPMTGQAMRPNDNASRRTARVHRPPHAATAFAMSTTIQSGQSASGARRPVSWYPAAV